MIKSLSIALLTLGLSAGAIACPDGKCPDGKCPLKHSIAQKLNIEGDRAAQLDALEAQFKQEMTTLHESHKAKLAAILTPEELTKLDNGHHEHGEGHRKAKPLAPAPSNKTAL